MNRFMGWLAYRGPTVNASAPCAIGRSSTASYTRMLSKCGKATAEALVESALWEASLFEEERLGVTEAGPAFQGARRDSVADAFPKQRSERDR